VTRREITIAVVVLAVLAALAAWQRWPREAAPVGPVAVFADGTPAPDEVAAIELWQEGPDGARATLQRRGDRWSLATRDRAPVDPERVQRLLDAVDGLVGEVRVDDEALLPEFRLAGDGVIHLQLRDAAGEIRLHLLVGKRGPASNRSFVRPDGDPRAWLAHAALHSSLGLHGRNEPPLDPDFFLDLHLFRVEADDVLAIRAEGGDPWAIARDAVGAPWTWDPARDGDPPDDRQATGKAHTAARLRASALVGAFPPPDTGLDDPVARVHVRTADGVTRTLLVGAMAPPPPPEADETPAEPDERYVRMADEAWVWRARLGVIEGMIGWSR